MKLRKWVLYPLIIPSVIVLYFSNPFARTWYMKPNASPLVTLFEMF